MWEEHTRLMTQLVTLMRVSVVLLTGLRGDPTVKHKSTVKPETQGTQEDLGVQRPCPAPWEFSIHLIPQQQDFKAEQRYWGEER